jgi:hypothetical protein
MTRHEPLTHQRLIDLLDVNPEKGVFTWKLNKGGKGKQNKEAGTSMWNGYIKIGIDGKEYLAHRLMWMYVYGEFPKTNIDHKDRCRSNNCISNLRTATPKQNAENMFRSSTNTSGYRGVHFNKRLKKNPWSANITHNGKTIHIGYFETAEQASSARKSTENLYFTHHKS